MKEFLIVFSVLSLFAAGLFITLQSRDVNVGHGAGESVIAGNFSAMVCRVLAYLAGLAAVQYVVGYPLTLGF